MIYQVLPSISKFDAISQHCLRIDEELKRRGIETQIVAEHIGAEFSEIAKSPLEITSFNGSHVLYHLSISNHIADQILNSDATIDIWYHNITPAEYFEDWEPFIALELRIARTQLAQFAIRARRGVCASQFSERELQENGCRYTSVMPVLFDPSSKIALRSSNSTNSTKKIILSVGRYAPHKRIEKLIETFYLYSQMIDGNAELHLVGSQASEPYQIAVTSLIDELDIKEKVVFHDHISDGDLSALYARADVYLCMSLHEGFCVPLLEALHNSLPIVSSESAAIPETLNGAGILLDGDAPLLEYLAALDLAINDKVTRNYLIEASKKSAKAIDLNVETRRAVDWLTFNGDFEDSEMVFK